MILTRCASGLISRILQFLCFRVMGTEIERLGKALRFTDVEEGGFDFSRSVWSRPQASSDLSLVRKLLTQKSYNFSAFSSVFRSIFNPGKGRETN